MQIGAKHIPWRDAGLGLAFILVLYFTLPYIGVNTFGLVMILIMGVEWVTKFILPWVVLYWVVRVIKRWESK